MTKFNIGDVVYLAQAGQESIWVICPECMGSGRLRVILGDDSEVSIACVCCDRGYEGSPGKLQTYAFRSETHETTITGIDSEMHDGALRTHYKFGGCHFTEDKNIFATRADALIRAAELIQEHEIEEAKRLRYKEKKHKTWAWNVRYWRSEIRRAQETITRIQARLNVAPKNVKEADKQEQS